MTVITVLHIQVSRKCHPNKCNQTIFFQAVMITGGDGPGATEQSVEVILEDGSTCTMPDLPPPGRSQHSATGLTLCGGSNGVAATTCSKFNGEWEISHNLPNNRPSPESWQSPNGIYLIGGLGSPYTSEVIDADGNTESAFDLTDETRFVRF